MNKLNRREALTALAATGIAAIAPATALSHTPQMAVAPAFSGKHQPKPLPFDPTKLNGLSERLIRSHHENNYTGSVRALNVVENRLAAMMNDKDLPAYIYGDLKRQELIRTGSVVLHERYFANLGGNGKPDGNALNVIKQNWGSFEAWEGEFKRVGNSLAGGSGWTIFGFNLHTRQYHNYWAADHTTSAAFTVPIIVLDMYEHSYQMDYGAAAAKYVDAFMLNINWDEVNRRVDALK